MARRLARWLEIRDSLQRDMEQGTLPVGALIPSERELANRYQVSRMTIRQVLGYFAATGALLPRQGLGTVVATPLITKNALGLASFSEEMRRRGLSSSSRVLRCDLAIANQEQMASLQLATPETVFILRRVRLANGEPLVLEECAIPIRLAPGIEQCDFSQQSLYELLARRYGVRPSHTLETVTGRQATEEERQLLAMPASAALLCVRRRTFTASHQPCEFVESLYRGDAYSIDIHLRRLPQAANGAEASDL
ncbi:MAG TPA: GntR family transcriptional regulator [Chloroflexota bacterium]|nr:GntR family transcriptional regulator [Chloroflexota bacterium]